MYDEAVHDYADTLELVPDWCQEMCVKAISKNHFMLEYCHDRWRKKCALKLLIIFYQH